jgi:S-adenosylmethionine decarboxylase
MLPIDRLVCGTPRPGKGGGNFGPHLALDLMECDPARLGDLQLIFAILYHLPELIGMQRITQPYVFPYEGSVPEDAGITGMTIIAESHISVHTFVSKKFAFVDIFSCKAFDLETASSYFIERFAAQGSDRWIVYRGRGFPRGR